MKKKAISPDRKSFNIETYRKKKKRERFLRRLGGVAVMLLLAAAVIGGAYLFQNYDVGEWLKRTQANLSSDGLRAEGFPVSMDAAQPKEIQALGDHLVLLTHDELAIFSQDGALTNQVVHGYTNPVLKPGGSRLLLYDRGGYGYRVEGERENLAEGRTQGVIQTGASGHRNVFALATSTPRYAGSVTVYGKKGEELLTWYSTEQIVDMDFSADDKYLAVASIAFSNEGLLNARIHVLSLDKGEELRSTDFPDALPVAINYQSDGSLHLVADTFLGILSKDFSDQKKIPFQQQLKMYRFTDYGTFWASTSENEVSFNLSFVQSNGERQIIRLRSAVTDVSLSKEGIAVLAGGRLYQYDFSWEPKLTRQVSTDVFKIVWNGKQVYTLSASLLDVLPAWEAGG